MPSKSRGWVFTINNFTADDVENIERLTCVGIRCSEEVGESGTPHLQGAVYFENPRALGGVKRLISARAHLEPMKGSWDDQQYCLGMHKVDGQWVPGKPGWVRTIIDRGSGPAQGNRVDIAGCKRMIDEGASVEEVLDANFEAASRCLKSLDRYSDYKRRRIHRSWMTKGIWYHGPTGSGKSHAAFEDYSVETHYIYEATDNGWWDGYAGQETVVINDFRGEIKYNELLALVDKWPKSVKRRCREPTPFLAKTVIITSSLAPDLVYKQRLEEDRLEQLLRRFEVRELTERDDDESSTLGGGQVESDRI